MIPERSTISPSSGQEKSWGKRLSGWASRHPFWAIALVSLLAVVINNYPVIFCGKSYVSPACVPALVYNWQLPGPGIKGEISPPPNRPHGSDTEAMMWWGVPVGFIESRSVLEHGTLPLWNRYSHAGDTLIGQAVSMLGDPLQLIVIFGHGTAAAWDIKFLTAKFIFCVGFGLLIRRLLGNGPLSLVYAALAAYCGAFFYINNHPVFFVFAYAPWVLLAAVEWLGVRSKNSWRWGLAWLLANFSCFNAGHVEVAVVLIGGLNLAALINALMECHRRADGIKVLGRMAVATLLFLGLTAPVWISFLTALAGSFTAHAEVNVVQLPLVTLPGLFDDLFYLLLRANDTESAFAPGTSLLILVGCCFSLTQWRQFKRVPFFWVNVGAILLWGGCVFGWVPAAILEKIPLLNRVGHLYTDFSYLLVIHLTIQSAYGFLGLARAQRNWKVMIDVGLVGLVFAVIFWSYPSGYSHQPIPWDYFLCVVAAAIGAPLLFVFLKGRPQQTQAIGWAGILVLGFIPNLRFGLYSFGNDALLMLPGPRMNLSAPSEAVDKIKAIRTDPFRIAGLQWNLMGDYPAVYEIEDIRSCAPLSNMQFMDLVRYFPGMEFTNVWMIQINNPVQAQSLLNMLNIKYLFSRSPVGIEAGIDFRANDLGDFYVVENLQVWPRAFFTDHIVSVDGNEGFIQYLMAHGRQPFAALTGEEIKAQPGLQRLAGDIQPAISPAANYRLLPNSTEFDIHAASAGVVCLTEGQAKDFTATANGKPQKVLTVNRAFKGIYLDQPGDYHVKFTYRPRHWRIACAAFWISLGGVALWGMMDFMRRRKSERQKTDELGTT